MVRKDEDSHFSDDVARQEDVIGEIVMKKAGENGEYCYFSDTNEADEILVRLRDRLTAEPEAPARGGGSNLVWRGVKGLGNRLHLRTAKHRNRER